MNKRLIYICISLLFLLLVITGCAPKAKTINTVSDLNGRTLIVETGTSFESSIAANGCVDSPNYLYGSTTSDAVELLIGSKGDALVIDKPAGQSLIYRYPQLKMLDYTFDNEYMGLAMQKGSRLKDEINGAIKVLNSSGVTDELINKWMGDDPSLKVVEKQASDDSRETLRVAVEAGFEPICYLNDAGEPVGLDIDLLNRIGMLINKNIEITVLSNFNMLIPGVEENLFDLAAGGITITKERLEHVDFSESYYETCSVFIVKDSSAAAASFTDTVAGSFRRTFIENERWKDILSGLGMTVLLVIITGLIGIILGSLLFLWYYSGNKAGVAVTNALSQLFLYLPTSTWLFIAFYLIFRGRMGIPMLVAGFAMSILFSIDVLANLRSSIESVDKGQFEAAYALGYSKYQAFLRIALPQTMPDILSTLQEDLVMHVRTTSLVGLISAVDIQMAFDMIRSETKDTVIPILFTTAAYIGLGIGFSAVVKGIKLRFDRSGRTPEQIAADIKRGAV